MKKIDFIPIKKLNSLHFIVKDYQRGYKWEQEQIVALLNDIDHHVEGKYCLQPVIVEERIEGIELIDGQQRMTTIFLLLHYLGYPTYYTIDYQTREASQEFITHNMPVLHEAITIEKKWNTFIKEDSLRQFDNVDVFHFYLVYAEIHKWFLAKTEEVKVSFIIKLLNQVHVIWYDINANAKNQQAEDVFLNLNAGKIPLTSSELIKALFILDVQNRNSKEIAKLKAAELATEWDAIENQLHEPDFWYFICDHSHYINLDTRIDFIIDLANEVVPKKDWDGMDSYRKYEKDFLEKNELNWNKIKQTYNKLNEWYKDKELYHYVGFLVVTGIKSLKDIVKESKGKNKDAFKDRLVEFITIEFKKIKRVEENKSIAYYELDNLNYEDYRTACQNVLLLFNVQYYLNNLSQNKFPFDLYKRELWSVEHINPQNPKEFKTIGAIIKWMQSFHNYFKSVDKETELTGMINDVIVLLNTIENTERKLAEIRWPKENIEKLQKVIDAITDKLDLHGISNLALLDRNSNSKLGNKVFIDKRKDILELYYSGKKHDVFIPECTKDVFTKNYTKEAQNISDEIFGFQDMEDYKFHLENQLKNFYTV